MPIRFALQKSWYDAYLDPDEFNLLQATINQHLPVGITLDWPALLAAERQQLEVYEVNRDAAGEINEALRILCGSGASTAERLDFIPIPLTTPLLNLSNQELRWYLYSAYSMVANWRSVTQYLSTDGTKFAPFVNGIGAIAQATIDQHVPARTFW